MNRYCTMRYGMIWYDTIANCVIWPLSLPDVEILMWRRWRVFLQKFLKYRNLQKLATGNGRVVANASFSSVIWNILAALKTAIFLCSSQTKNAHVATATPLCAIMTRWLQAVQLHAIQLQALLLQKVILQAVWVQATHWPRVMEPIFQYFSILQR